MLHFHCRRSVLARAAPLPINSHLSLSSGGSVELHSIAVDADCGGRTNTKSTIPTVMLPHNVGAYQVIYALLLCSLLIRACMIPRPENSSWIYDGINDGINENGLVILR
jgi:hypothetical protein